MTTYEMENGIVRIPELPVGTEFKVGNYFSNLKEYDSVIKVMENHPDSTGDCPCCGEHDCAFYMLCDKCIDCPCSAQDRKDGKNVVYVQFINGEEMFL